MTRMSPIVHRPRHCHAGIIKFFSEDRPRHEIAAPILSRLLRPIELAWSVRGRTSECFPVYLRSRYSMLARRP